MKNITHNFKILILKDQTPIEGKPIQLIYAENGKLKINEHAMETLTKIEGKIAICGVIGPMRTGKSYLLNLLLNRTSGFDIGKEVRSCTKGCWIWDQPIKHYDSEGNEFKVILMDTEGLEATDATQELDNRIFVLTILLSSLLVYNTISVLDRAAIKKLGIMTNLANFINNDISYKNDSSDVKLSQGILLNSPDFIWVLRDFHLDMSQFPTPKDYLNFGLQLEESKNDADANSANIIRDSIKKSFKSLDCCCLPFPVVIKNSSDLQNLDQIKYNELHDDFKKEINSLINIIRKSIRPKLLFGLELNGLAYKSYIENVVDKLNNSEKVSLTESLTMSIRYAGEKSLDKAIQSYEKKSGVKFSDDNLPMEWYYFEQEHEKIMKESIDILKAGLIGENTIGEKIVKKFHDKVIVYDSNINITGGLYLNNRVANSDAIKKYNKNLLNANWKKYFKYLTRDANLNTADDFKKDFENFEKNYFINAFGKIEPEMSEAYTEWYNQKDIENIIKHLEIISDNAKEAMQVSFEKQVLKTKNLRLEADKKDAEKIVEVIQKQMDDITNEMEKRFDKSIFYLNKSNPIKDFASAVLDSPFVKPLLGGLVSAFGKLAVEFLF